MGGDPGELCVPVHPEGQVLLGEVIINDEDRAVTITDVAADDARAVRVTGAFILPIHGTPIGSELLPSSSGGWVDRESLSTPRATRDKTINIGLSVERREDAEGTIGRIHVRYEVGGNSYTTAGSTRYVLADSCL